ncbi:MAG: hypothetical protein O2931_15915, partial [Planctomycetota bacterium]|nr:hypothetical protein [Planctomycetota bacterium]
DGNFLYLKEAFQSIESGQFNFSRLDELPKSLGRFFHNHFELKYRTPESYFPVRRVLEVILAAQEPLNNKQLATATGLEIDYELPPVLNDLSVYLTEQEGGYSIYHRSFADWLVSSDLEGTRFFVSRRKGHENIAAMLFGEFSRGVNQMSGYGSQHILTHLLRAMRWDELDQVLSNAELFARKVKEQSLLTVAREWADIAETMLKAVRKPPQDQSANRYRYVQPMIIPLIELMEENVTGRFGIYKEECLPACRLLQPVELRSALKLFEDAAEHLGPTVLITETPIIRAVLCAIQLYGEIRDNQRGYEMGKLSIRSYPNSFKVAHFAAMAAGRLGITDPKNAESIFNEALQIEQYAVGIPNAEKDFYFSLSDSEFGMLYLRLHRLYATQCNQDQAEYFLDKSIHHLKKRVSVRPTPLSLAYYADALLAARRHADAYVVARAATESGTAVIENVTLTTRPDWFVPEAHLTILKLAEHQPFDVRYDPPLYQHLRFWTIAVSQHDAECDLSQHPQNHAEFLLSSGLEPEALARYPQLSTRQDPTLNQRCQAARRTSRRIVMQISKGVIDCEVDVWEFEGQSPHVVIGILSLNVFAQGRTFIAATEYLREYLIVLYDRIANGRWAHLRSADVREVRRWLEDHVNNASQPDQSIGSTLLEAGSSYQRGKYIEADQILDSLESVRSQFDIEQLHLFLRYRAWVAAARGENNGIEFLQELSRLMPTPPKLIADYMVVLKNTGFVPGPEIDDWIACGERVFGNRRDPGGWSALFREFRGGVMLARGHVDEAQQLFSMAINDEQGGYNSPRILARICSQLAECHRMRGAIDVASQLLETARTIQTRDSYHGDLAELTMTNLAKLQSNTDAARALLEEARELEDASGNKRGLARTLLVEARQTEDRQRANEIFQQMSRLRSELPALRDCPLTNRILTHWDEWTSGLVSPEQDYWGL